MGLRCIDRGDILLGSRAEEVRVSAVDVWCEPLPDRVQSWASGLDDRLRTHGGRHEHQLRLAMRVGGGVTGDSGYGTADAAHGDERRPLRRPNLSQELQDLGHDSLSTKGAAGYELEARRR